MKYALVTGASGGIGKAIVKKLILEGYVVYGQYNQNEIEIDSLSLEIEKLGYVGSFFPVQFDLCDIKQIDAKISEVLGSIKGFDILVNNACVVN